MRVCEDALDRQVLRQAGAVYQFRHAELQDHLAASTANAGDAAAVGDDREALCAGDATGGG
jgi:hypothetical protein